jgi:hypothetical protein
MIASVISLGCVFEFVNCLNRSFPERLDPVDHLPVMLSTVAPRRIDDSLLNDFAIRLGNLTAVITNI